MSLLHLNIIAMTVSCMLLIGGYSAREHRLGGVGMFAGIIGLMLLIALNIYQLLHG